MQPGGYLSSSAYDRYGNETRILTPGNMARALNQSSTDSVADEAAIAERLSTTNAYNTDGQQLLDTFGPEHDVVLPDGSTVRGRTHTHNTYDQGAPAGGPYNLITTTTTSARYVLNGIDTDTDTRTTTADYNWNLRRPTATTVDPNGLNLVTAATYDATTGLPTSTTAPAGVGSTTTPSTRVTIYYRAGTGSGYNECDNRPDMANLPCRIQPGGQPTGGAQLPATVITYDMLNQPRVLVEKSATGTLRTTTTTYDTAGRPYEISISAPALGTTVPSTRYIFDQTTAHHTGTQSITSGAVTAELVRTYDTLGRLIAYTDADGIISTTSYDILGRTATSNDGKATRTYTYDGLTERRGLLTKVVDGQAGTFVGAYDANGSLVAETWPTGVTARHAFDETGVAIGVGYYLDDTCTTTACLLYEDRTHHDAHGLVRADRDTFDIQTFRYDAARRLRDVEDATPAGCALRQYAFDTATNRTGLSVYQPDSTCSANNVTAQRAWTYDSADRNTGTGYAFDDLGRTIAVPAADTINGTGAVTVTYHSSDFVDTITQNGRTTDYALDVTGKRIRSWVDTDIGPASSTHHYDDDTDSPSWTQETATTYSRIVSGISDVAGVFNSATTVVDYQVANLHGDVAATIHGDDTALSATIKTTEFGALSSTNPPVRYGWLGTHQRAADTPAGVILMGVRLYNPATGRFLQEDPVYGGNATSYDYCGADPINCLDIDGEWSFSCRWCKAVAAVARPVVRAAVSAAGRALNHTVTGGIRAAAYGVKAVRYIKSVPSRTSVRGGSVRYNGDRYGWRAGYDRKVHPFKFVGNRRHLQINWWQKGAKKSGGVYRLPLPW